MARPDRGMEASCSRSSMPRQRHGGKSELRIECADREINWTQRLRTLLASQIWSNPSPGSTPSIHFPPLGYPMAHMTENTNLQRALLRRIDEVGKGLVDIREGSRVGEMVLGKGERWVGLQIGGSWVRGSVVVS